MRKLLIVCATTLALGAATGAMAFDNKDTTGLGIDYALGDASAPAQTWQAPMQRIQGQTGTSLIVQSSPYATPSATQNDQA